MVKKKCKRKSTRRNLNSTSKEIAGVSVGGDRKDLTPLNGQEDDQLTVASLDLQKAAQGQPGFPDKVYLLASVIFHNNHVVRPATHRVVNYGQEGQLSLPELRDDVMQRSAYELAFNALKYQELLEEIMVDCCLYLTQPKPDHQMSLVAVMLYDFQDRKFLTRAHTEDQAIQEVRDVENYLLQFKTKLAASLARSRIKHGLLSMEYILPKCVRQKEERSRSLPLYAWVNRLRSSHAEVQGALKQDGLFYVKSIKQLVGPTFCQDSHCGDTLVFPAQLRTPASFSKLLRDHKLIIQDKSCILPPNAAASLLPEGGDVLMVGCFSAFSVAHTASLIAEKYEGNKRDHEQPACYVCATHMSEHQREELQITVSKMGCRNVKIIPQVFHGLPTDDKRLGNVRVILLTPRCSMSAVSNTVKFILQENGDPGLLQDLSRGSIAQGKLEGLAAQQRKDIDHALKFPQVSAVVYCTCSSYQEENQDAINDVLHRHNASSEREGEPEQTKFRPSPFSFSSPDQAEAVTDADPFFTLEPSELNNGCFLAVLRRELTLSPRQRKALKGIQSECVLHDKFKNDSISQQPEPVVKEPPEDIIARANAKGILDRISTEGQRNLTRVSKGHTPTTQKPGRSIPRKTQPRSSSSISSISSSSSSIKPRHTNQQQPQQAKLQGLHFQPLKSTAVAAFRDSRLKHPNSSPPSSSTHPENDTPIEILPHAINIKAPVCRTAPPAAPVLRPRRAQTVQEPVGLVLPTVHFPSLLPPCSGGSHSPWYSKWKTPPQLVPLFPSKGFSKWIVDKTLQ